jgi:hypothetical protein
VDAHGWRETVTGRRSAGQEVQVGQGVGVGRTAPKGDEDEGAVMIEGREPLKVGAVRVEGLDMGRPPKPLILLAHGTVEGTDGGDGAVGDGRVLGGMLKLPK